MPNHNKAINYETDDCPPQLKPYIELMQFAEIMRNVNYIIQKNVFKQKYQIEESGYPYVFPIVLFCIVLLLVLVTAATYSNSQQYSQALLIISGLVISASFVLIIGYSMSSYHEQI